jgi:hypothetical protein
MIFWNTIKPFNGTALSLVPQRLVFRYLYYVTESQFVVLFVVKKCGGKSPYLYIRYLVFITQKYQMKLCINIDTILHMVHMAQQRRVSEYGKCQFLISVEAPKVGSTHL